MNDEQLLNKMKDLISILKEDQSTYWKQGVLQQYSECKDILKRVYNPFEQFNVTADGILTYIEEYGISPIYNGITLNELLDMLSKREITGNAAKSLCVSYINHYEEYEDTILAIIDKDLRCGIKAKTINKVWKNLVPTFDVPLAKDYEADMSLFQQGEPLWVSRKMDGIRCLVFIPEDGRPIAYSRKGKEFWTLDKVLTNITLNWKGDKNIILDGEISINGNFQETIRQIRRKNHTIEIPVFHVFDCYTIEEFNESTSSSKPYSVIQSYLKENLDDGFHIEKLQQTPVNNYNELWNTISSIPQGWEGYIIRQNNPTQFKRSKNLLKVKNWKEAEYTVLDVEMSNKLIDGMVQDCCGSLTIDHKGYTVDIGSGLSDLQRLHWYDHPETIIGKTITVKYFEETVDKKGELSLRFPILKGIRED